MNEFKEKVMELFEESRFTHVGCGTPGTVSERAKGGRECVTSPAALVAVAVAVSPVPVSHVGAPLQEKSNQVLKDSKYEAIEFYINAATNSSKTGT